MTLYLQPGPFGGDGSREAPLRISSAEMFDAVLDRFNDGGEYEYDTLDLAEGVFETRGVWNFPDFTTFPRSVHIRGAGTNRTTIRLSGDPVTQTNLVERPDLAVLWFGVPARNNGGPYTVEDLTIDGNCAAIPDKLVTGGLVFHSNNVTCQNVRVKGLRGSFTLPHQPEAFGILVNNFDSGPWPGPDGNNRIVDCVCESNGDTEEYVSPFYIGVRERGRALMQSEIVGCRTIGTGVKPCRLGVSLQSGVVIERFSAHNVQHAIYNDVGPVKDAVVRNSRFTGVTYSGPFIVVDAPKERILIDRCEFEFTPPPDKDWIGLTIWDKENSGAVAEDIEVRDCVFRGEGTKKFTPWSIKAKVKGIRFSNNATPTHAVLQQAIAGVTLTPRL